MNVLSLTYAELLEILQCRYGKGSYHAKALYGEIFKKGRFSCEKAPELRTLPNLAQTLAGDALWPPGRIQAQKRDHDTLKFISMLPDGHLIESVIIPSRHRVTLCVSSQAGCRMGCRFCTTGQRGLVRSLSAAEIVWQVWAARFELKQPIGNIVFMGMGEPLDNFVNVRQALRVMADQRGLDIAYRHITVSSAGHAEGIRRLSRLNMPNLRLAVSINSADDSLRSHLMPINRKYPLPVLKKALRQYARETKGIIFVEYVLLSGINDSRADAQKLASYLSGLPVRVNALAYNSNFSGAFKSPAPEQVKRFCQWLREMHLFACPRVSRGQRIRAACGQLGGVQP